MYSFDISLSNLEYLDMLAKALSPAEFARAVLPGMQRGFYMLHQHVPPYPAPPPESSYVRTGKLGQSINTDVYTAGNEVIGVIGSNISYAPYVIGSDDEQAWMHEGRWWQMVNVVEQDLDLITDEIVRALENYLAYM